MAIAHLVQGIANGNASSGAVTIDTTGANLIVVAISRYSFNTGVSFTDSKSNSGWQTATDYGTNGTQVEFRYVLNPSYVGGSHTFTYAASGGNGYISIAALAFSGVNAFDAVIGRDESTSTSRSTDTITPSANGSLLIAAESFNSSSTESGAGTHIGFQQVNHVAATCHGAATSYYIQTTAASIQETFSGSSVERSTSQICFTPAAATGQALLTSPGALVGGALVNGRLVQ